MTTTDLPDLLPVPETIRFVLDENCPRCNFPETIAVSDPRDLDSGPLHNTCNRCGWHLDRRTPDPADVKAAQSLAQAAITDLARMSPLEAWRLMDAARDAAFGHAPALVVGIDTDDLLDPADPEDADEYDQQDSPRHVLLCPVHGQEVTVTAVDQAERWTEADEMSEDNYADKELHVWYDDGGEFHGAGYIVECPTGRTVHGYPETVTHPVSLPDGWTEV